MAGIDIVVAQAVAHAEFPRAISCDPDPEADVDADAVVYRAGPATVGGAKIEAESPGGEAVDAEQVVARQAYRVTIRYMSWLSTKHSIVLRGARYQIRAVSHTGPRGRTTEAVVVLTEPREITTP